MPLPGNSCALCSRWNAPNSLCRLRHVEAHTIVAHEVDARGVRRASWVVIGRSKFDPGGGGLGGELPRVTEEVPQHHAQQPAVPRGGQSGGNGHRDLPLRIHLPQFGNHRLCQRAQIHRVVTQLGTAGEGELKQVVDELCHLGGHGAHPL